MLTVADIERQFSDVVRVGRGSPDRRDWQLPALDRYVDQLAGCGFAFHLTHAAEAASTFLAARLLEDRSGEASSNGVKMRDYKVSAEPDREGATIASACTQMSSIHPTRSTRH